MNEAGCYYILGREAMVARKLPHLGTRARPECCFRFPNGFYERYFMIFVKEFHLTLRMPLDVIGATRDLKLEGGLQGSGVEICVDFS
jgi:hypothetical protein